MGTKCKADRARNGIIWWFLLPAIITAENSFEHSTLYIVNHKEFYKSRFYWLSLHEIAKFLK